MVPSYSTSLTIYALSSLPFKQLEYISGCKNYMCFVYLLKNKVYHSQASLDDVKWAVGWTQPDLFSCEDVILIIGIGQGLLATWQKLTFSISLVLVRIYWLDDKEVPLECHWIKWQRANISKLLFFKGCDQMAGDLGKLRGTTKPDSDHVWNGSGTIKSLAGSLESQIGHR